jgi:hypothetical protein
MSRLMRSSGAIGLLALLAMLVLTSFLYRPGLVDVWVFDDHPNLGPLLEDVRTGGSMPELLEEHAFSGSGPTGRPVSMLTFVVDGVVRGTDLAGWKQTNLVLHLACGSLIFLLVRALARTFSELRPGAALALAVAGLWLLHPLHLSTVLYTVQRMTLLSTLFQLAGMLGYLGARSAFLAGRPTRGWLCLAISVACLALGVLSKENGALLLVYIILFEALIITGGHAHNTAEKRWARRAMLLGIGAGLVGTTGWFALGHGLPIEGYGTRPFTLEERLLTQPRVLLEYARLTVLPNLAGMKFIHDDIVISRGWFAPWTTAVAAAVLAIFAWSAWLARRRLPLYSFGVGLYLCGHLLESTVIPLDLMYEHRQYFPSFGLLLATAALGVRLVSKRWLAVVVVLLLCALLSAMTWQRAGAWSSEARLFQEMLRINPDSPRAMAMVANWFGNRGEYTAARALLARLDSPAARLNALYYDCVERGEVPAAALAALPDPEIVSFYEASGLMHLGRAGLAGHCQFPKQAYLDLLARWLAQPVHASRGGLLIYRAYYLDRLGRADAALETLEEAYRYGRVRSSIALVIAAELAIDAGWLEQAERLLTRARESNRTSRRDSSADIDMAVARLAVAREHPAELRPFDPFQEPTGPSGDGR